MTIKHKGLISVGLALSSVAFTWIHYTFVQYVAFHRELDTPFPIRFFGTFLVAAYLSVFILGFVVWLSILSFQRKDGLVVKITLLICSALIVGIPLMIIFKPFTPGRPFVEVFASSVSTSEHLDSFVLWARETLAQWSGDPKDQTLVDDSRLPKEVYRLYDPQFSPTLHVFLHRDSVSKEKALTVLFYFGNPCGISIGETNYIVSHQKIEHIQKVRDGVYVFESSRP